MYDNFVIIILAAFCLISAIWIGYICLKRYEFAIFLIAISPFISAIFVSNDSIDQTTTTGSYLRVCLLFLIGFIGFIKFFQFQKIFFERIPLYFKLLVFFVIIALLSTLYSLEPSRTLIRSLSFFALLGFLFGFFAWLKDINSVENALNSIFFMIFVVVSFNLIAFVLFRDRIWWREENRFCGLWGSPNMMGLFSMVSYPIIYWKYSKTVFPQRLGILLLLVILFFLHILTGSRSSLFASFLGFIMGLFVLKQNKKLIISLIATSLLIVIIFYSKDYMKSFVRETDDSTSMTTLTGRTEFWKGSLILISEKPILGYGYGVGGKIWEDPRFNEPELALWSGNTRSSLHNGYLSTIIGVGLIGFLVWSLLLVLPLWFCRKLPVSNYKAIFIALLFMCLIINFVEGAIGPGSDPSSIIFWIITVIVIKASGTNSFNWFSK